MLRTLVVAGEAHGTLAAGGAPREIMGILARREKEERERLAAAWRAAGRNDPCPCRSGRKFKRGCLPKAR